MLAASPCSNTAGGSSGYSQLRPSMLASLRKRAIENSQPSIPLQKLTSIRARAPGPTSLTKDVEPPSCAHSTHEIVLNGKTQLAASDNQASANIMSLKVAISEGMRMERVRVPFMFGDGSIRHCIGRVTAHCSLSQSSSQFSQPCEFYVFRNPVESIILGRKFLHDAGISRYPTRFRRQSLPVDNDADAQSIWTSRSLNHIEYSRWQIRAALRYCSIVEDCAVVCDTGSDFNVMSFAYAQKIGIQVKRFRRYRENVHLADDSHIKTLGFVYASIIFHGRAGRMGHIPIRFELIDGSPFDVALGNPRIQQFRVFEDMQDFDWVFTDDHEALLCMWQRRQGVSLRIESESPSRVRLRYFSEFREQLMMQGKIWAGSGEGKSKKDAAVARSQNPSVAATPAIGTPQQQPATLLRVPVLMPGQAPAGVPIQPAGPAPPPAPAQVLPQGPVAQAPAPAPPPPPVPVQAPAVVLPQDVAAGAPPSSSSGSSASFSSAHEY